MPNAFDITTASTTVQIDDATRKGVASYTVKNICGRPLRGEAKLESDQPQLLEAGKEWIKFDGPEFRDFSAEGAEQFTIQIGVPMQAPAGTYGFWMKVIGIENPDEMTDVGPNINFNVKELPKPDPWYKKLKWWVWAIAGGVLLLIVTLILVLALVPLTPETFTDSINLDSSFSELPLPSVDLGSNQGLILFRGTIFTTEIRITKIALKANAVLPHSRAKVRSAILRLHVPSGSGITPSPFRLRASSATSSWNESNASPAPGCDTQQVSIMPVTTGATVVEIDVTEIYQKMVDAGSGNFGICLTTPEPPNYILVLESSESPNVANRPEIIIEYLRPVFSSSN